MSNNLPELSV